MRKEKKKYEIYATDGWYASRRYLTAEEEAFLNRLSDGLQTEDMKVTESILAAFGQPKTRV